MAKIYSNKLEVISAVKKLFSIVFQQLLVF